MICGKGASEQKSSGDTLNHFTESTQAMGRQRSDMTIDACLLAASFARHNYVAQVSRLRDTARQYLCAKEQKDATRHAERRTQAD